MLDLKLTTTVRCELSGGALGSLRLSNSDDDLALAMLPIFKGDPGEQGDPGPPGPAGASYQHYQAAPLYAWTVNHNLGFRPQVEVFTVGWVEIEAQVVNTSDNQTVIYFNVAQAGFARFN